MTDQNVTMKVIRLNDTETESNKQKIKSKIKAKTNFNESRNFKYFCPHFHHLYMFPWVGRFSEISLIHMSQIFTSSLLKFMSTASYTTRSQVILPLVQLQYLCIMTFLLNMSEQHALTNDDEIITKNVLHNSQKT